MPSRGKAEEKGVSHRISSGDNSVVSAVYVKVKDGYDVDTVNSALTGKLLVWTIVFSAIGFILVLILYHQMHFPMAGSIFNMFIAMFLMVLASEAIAIFILEMLPVPRLALSVGALYSVLGFSLSGFTLPLEAMPPYIQGLAAAFPIRYYYLFHVQEAIFGTGFAGWW